MATDLSSHILPIPAGTIELRDDRIKQKWTVEIRPFGLAAHPVTQALYAEVMQDWPSTFKGDSLPVETVSWKDAATFCNALSLREALQPCYTFYADSEEITFDPHAPG